MQEDPLATDSGITLKSPLAWLPIREDGNVPFFYCSGPRVLSLPDLGRVIPPTGSAFGRNGRGWIANAPLSLHLKQRVFNALPELLPALSQPGTILGFSGLTDYGNFAEQPDPAFARTDSTAETEESMSPAWSDSELFPKGLPHPWRVEETPEDGCLDFSRFSFVPEYFDTFAWCFLNSDEEGGIEGQVPVLGPYGVGVNGKWIFYRKGPFGYVEPEWVNVRLPLRKGLNRVVLFGQMIGWREARIVVGMRFPAQRTTLRVGLPLEGQSPDQWKAEQEFFRGVGVRQFCFPDGKVFLYIGKEIPEVILGSVKGEVRVELSLHGEEVPLEREAPPTKQPYWTAQLKIGGGSSSGESKEAQGGKVVVEPDPAFLQSLRRTPPHVPLEVRLRIPHSPNRGKVVGKVYLPRHSYSEVPFGDYLYRKKEALEVLSDIEEDPFGALAALALHKRKGLGSRVLGTCIDFLAERRDCADFYALALTVGLYAFGEEGRYARMRRDKGFSVGGATHAEVVTLPARLPDSEQEAIRKSLLAFKYWHDEPGVDAMCWFTENHQIIFHTAGYLAGSLFPHSLFSSSGLPGKKLAEKNERRLKAWILPRLQGGFSEWDSNTYLAMDIYALLALAEFAPSRAIRTLAITLLDKTFFMIACQSLRGAHGCSHGRCYTEGLKTARVESTSGLQRIAWGMGGFNGETWAAGMLALSNSYQVHPLVQAIGADMPPLLETKSCSYGRYYLKRDLRQGSWEVHTLSRRTPHYLLSAALDHRPGDPGIQEHLWQLSFSPEAVLFTTWPGNSQEHGNARPNYWAGSARLPRVAMESRSLVCLYEPQGHAGLGFGHAYCPRDVFDEVEERESWVFVRYGKGYGALRSDGVLFWVRTGSHAYQELRSEGGGKVFLVVAGSEEEDGDFGTFQKKCVSTCPSIQGTRVGWNTLDGQRLEFSWEGFLRISGKERSLRFPWHYQNLYTSTPLYSQTMVLQKEDETLTLDLAP